MNWLIIFAVIAVMAVARVRKVGMLTWLAVWWGGVFVLLNYGFAVPLPASVIKIYMGIVTLSLFAFVFTDTERMQEVWDPLVAFMVEKRFQPLLFLVVLAVPAAVAFQIYAGMTNTPRAPFFARTVHPAPPEQITVHDTEYFLGNAQNPYRELETSNPEEFAARVENGRVVYYENCFYCHGDMMAGAGLYSHGLNPIPTNFQDPGTIAMFQEGFLFWRISKGAPGMPEEGGPWESAMPAWENFLSEEEMWNVILFLYDFTGYKPRAVEEHH
jgi:mono/diheme cytochrome c family protein